MPQLKMYWKNDGKAAADVAVPSGCRIVSFTELDDAIAISVKEKSGFT